MILQIDLFFAEMNDTSKRKRWWVLLLFVFDVVRSRKDSFNGNEKMRKELFRQDTLNFLQFNDASAVND